MFEAHAGQIGWLEAPLFRQNLLNIRSAPVRKPTILKGRPVLAYVSASSAGNELTIRPGNARFGNANLFSDFHHLTGCHERP